MKFINPEILKQLKLDYTPGTRVILVQMDDPYSKLQAGDIGTVKCVDDIGTIHVKWDRGGSLGIVFGVDSCEKIEE